MFPLLYSLEKVVININVEEGVQKTLICNVYFGGKLSEDERTRGVFTEYYGGESSIIQK